MMQYNPLQFERLRLDQTGFIMTKGPSRASPARPWAGAVARGAGWQHAARRGAAKVVGRNDSAGVAGAEFE
jgi:hypothetical protein